MSYSLPGRRGRGRPTPTSSGAHASWEARLCDVCAVPPRVRLIHGYSRALLGALSGRRENPLGPCIQGAAANQDPWILPCHHIYAFSLDGACSPPTIVPYKSPAARYRSFSLLFSLSSTPSLVHRPARSQSEFVTISLRLLIPSLPNLITHLCQISFVDHLISHYSTFTGLIACPVVDYYRKHEGLHTSRLGSPGVRGGAACPWRWW